jgi:predicted  nucleic acid-binding Zn-ribbon protein
MPTSSNKKTLRHLTEKLAKQLLHRDAAASQAEAQNKELKHQLQDLQAWSDVARKFVTRVKTEKSIMQQQFAQREGAIVEREKRVKVREGAVDSRVILVTTCHALEQELNFAKRKIAISSSTHTETNKRAERREQELKFCKDEVGRLERTFVEHLHHVMKIQNETLSKIADDREMGDVQRVNERAREALESKLALACAEEGAEKGTGLGRLADELVDSMTATFGKSSNKAEELRNRVAQLEAQVTDLSTNLEKTTKEKVHLAQKLRSEQVSFFLGSFTVYTWYPLIFMY